MAIDHDRIKSSLFALIRAALPRVNYMAPRIARVIHAETDDSGVTLLDVRPDDPGFPPMGSVPLFHGVPGFALGAGKSSLAPGPGTQVLVEFSEGDPARPFVRSWGSATAIVNKEIFNGGQVFIGGEVGAEPPIKGRSYRAAEKLMNSGPTGLIATLTSMASACTGPLAPLQAGFTALAAAIAQFESTAATSADFQATKAQVN